jgi:hypothetical protein
MPLCKGLGIQYPTVVGPRYSNQKAGSATPSEHWVENPYLRQGELSATTFDINVAINAGMPIKDLTCSSHKVNAAYESASLAKVSLNKAEANGGNRDYILRYRLDGDKIQTGLLLTQGEKENFFVLMMQPPKRVVSANIPGREYIFIVDVSGSMHGFPLDISKRLMSNLIGNLRSTDRFNVLLFSGSSNLMAEESLPATLENIQKAIYMIEHQQGGGGTELLPALKRALSLKKEDGFARSVVIVTDGYVSVEEEAFDLIRKNLSNANMFAFGIGSSVNRHIIEGMAHVGMGEPFIITKPDAAQAQAERFRKLPEGVSDYAVGGSSNYTAAPFMQKSMGMAMRSKMESRLSEDKETAQEVKGYNKKDQAQKISIVSVTVEKGLTRGDILKVSSANLSQIGKCLAGKNLSGTIRLNLTLNSDGTVKNVEIATGVIKDEQLRKCIIAQVKQWQFPATASNQAVKVSIIIAFPQGLR